MAELKKYKSINATVEDFNAIDFNDVVYGEYSHSGAMGMAGLVCLHIHLMPW